MLTNYFEKLLERVEASEIGNNGKDANGFFLPTRSLLSRHLTLLKDLHGNPRAQTMVRESWQFVSENLPPEWLILTDAEKKQLKTILA